MCLEEQRISGLLAEVLNLGHLNTKQESYMFDRDVRLSNSEICVGFLRLAMDHFAPVKQDGNHPSASADPGVLTLPLLGHLAQ
jgi:hypothetical protein